MRFLALRRLGAVLFPALMLWTTMSADVKAQAGSLDRGPSRGLPALYRAPGLDPGLGIRQTNYNQTKLAGGPQVRFRPDKGRTIF